MASDDTPKADPAPKTLGTSGAPSTPADTIQTEATTRVTAEAKPAKAAKPVKSDGAETVAKAVAAMQSVAAEAKSAPKSAPVKSAPEKPKATAVAAKTTDDAAVKAADASPFERAAREATEAKPADSKPVETKPAESKPVEVKPIDSKTVDPKPAVVTPVAPAVAPRRSGAGALVGMLLGGAICLAAGYGAAVYLPRVLPQFDPLGLGQMRATLAAQADQIAALQAAPAATESGLEGRLAGVEAAQSGLAALTGRLDAVEGQLRDLPQGGSVPAGLEGDIAALRARVEALQAVAGDGGQQAVQAAVQAAEQAVAQQTQAARDQVGELVSGADTALRRTLAEAAVARLAAAVDSGLPYAQALSQLGVEAPKVLTDAAARGLPTLTTLRNAFPDAARLGLEAALVADLGNSWTDRAANFLRAQTGARSLAPREGTDPDAILSRAEAALAAGDARAALTEVEALPAPAQQAMSGWIDLARQRLEAEAAVADLAQKIGAE